MGKTNLLDAIYYLCYTKSYFQKREINNVLNGKEGFRIEGNWLKQQSATEKPDKTTCIFKGGKKSFLEKGIAYDRVSDHIGKYHAIMIAPDDLSLINEGSDLRRKFMDGLLAQTDVRYLRHLLSYQRILHQKNAYLKQTSLADFQWGLLDIYDEQLAQHGSVLLSERQKLSEFLPSKVQAFYRQLCLNETEETGFIYQPCCPPGQLLQLFKENRRYDLEYRRTFRGPHTEDWVFTLNGQPLKVQASQGQKKSFLISLKLSELAWLQSFEKKPMLLMDDIFEKLDNYRIELLFHLLSSFDFPQLFITHTEVSAIEKALEIYHKDNQLIRL